MIETLSQTLLEGVTGVFTAYLVDEEEVPVELASLTTLTLTYFDATTEAIINTRDEQDVLNANDVTLSVVPALVPGDPDRLKLTWQLQPADTVIVSDWKAIEYHTILLRWTSNSGLDAGAYGVNVGIVNLAYVPA